MIKSGSDTKMDWTVPCRTPFLCWPCRAILFLCLIPLLSLFPSPPSVFWAVASETASPIKSTWGGYVKLRGQGSQWDDMSYFATTDTGTFWDGNGEFRLTNETDFTDNLRIDVHYEAILSGGDTRKSAAALEKRFPDLFEDGLAPIQGLNDDRRLMNLTRVLYEDDSAILYHRIDRLALTLRPRWGLLRIGRQAITWGNGLIFNPMDLFNPFKPTDVEREYKIGDDMVLGQFSAGEDKDLQLLYVPRRDAVSGDISWDASSLAGKLHLFSGSNEFDLMAAHHYRDAVIGAGGRGYLKDAAWRIDTTWTFLRDDPEKSGYASMVANLDYSWVWKDKNFYGLLEFYYNGLGEEDYSEAIRDPAIMERISRGELFTLGRYYLAVELQVELHPLLNLYLGLINNIRDPSGVFQPRAVWEVTDNLRATLGANLAYGAQGTEYGGFNIPGTAFDHAFPNSAYLWVALYF